MQWLLTGCSNAGWNKKKYQLPFYLFFISLMQIHWMHANAFTRSKLVPPSLPIHIISPPSLFLAYSPSSPFILYDAIFDCCRARDHVQQNTFNRCSWSFFRDVNLQIELRVKVVIIYGKPFIQIINFQKAEVYLMLIFIENFCST